MSGYDNQMTFFHSDNDTIQQRCAHEGCEKEGLYPAPQNIHQPRSYYFFCLQHVREYNARWNFLKGLDRAGIEEQIRRATVWERPTWPFGKGPGTCKKSGKKQPDDNSELPRAIIESLAALDLEPPCTLTAIKKRYREMAKRFHPDTNQGNKSEIQRFHAVREAFGTLRTFYAKKEQTTYSQSK